MRLAQEEVESQRKRLAAEEAARAEEQKARELAAKSVPPLSPVQQPAPQPAVPKALAPSTSQAAAPRTQLPGQSTTNGVSTTQPAPAFSKTSDATVPPSVALTPSASGIVKATKPAPVPAPDANPKRQRALQIHKNLKALRNDINMQTGQNPALKNRAGDLRRELRKCVGQLSFDKKGNNVVVSISLTPTSRA